VHIEHQREAIADLDNAAGASIGIKRTGRVGYAPGAWDLFHDGHLNILKHASTLCDYLIVGVVSDEMLIMAKGRAPVIPLWERLEIVQSVRYVDEAVAEVVPEKLDTWREVGFDIIFKGDDWRGTPKGDKLERDFAAVGVEVIYFPYTAHTSSSQLRKVLDTLLVEAS
jgi:glycerol-3-phosphate cytidylyltransferase